MALTVWTGENKVRAFEEIIEWICSGKSVNSILLCKKDSMPSHTTFYAWVKNDANLYAKYARALKVRADVHVEQIIDIADDSSQDTKIVYNASGMEIEVEDKEYTSRSKLRVEARKWAASKMNPKKYGDKVEHDVQVTDKTIKFKFGEPITPEDIEHVEIE